MIETNSQVTWVVNNVEKEGVVLAFIPSNVPLQDVPNIPENVPEVAVSRYSRYLVKVLNGFDTPMSATVDRSNPELVEMGRLKEAQVKAQMRLLELQKSMQEKKQKEQAEAMSFVTDKVVQMLEAKGLTVVDFINHMVTKYNNTPEQVRAVDGITLLGKTQSLYAWCKEYNLSYQNARNYIKKTGNPEAVIMKMIGG